MLQHVPLGHQHHHLAEMYIVTEHMGFEVLKAVLMKINVF
jgi:hypothetical protein